MAAYTWKLSVCNNMRLSCGCVKFKYIQCSCVVVLERDFLAIYFKFVYLGSCYLCRDFPVLVVIEH